MTEQEIKAILDKHKLWLDCKDGGERANLDGANLVGANLAYVDLAGANLVGANLDGANLAGAKIHINYTIKGELHQLANVGSESGTLIIADCEEGWYFNRGCFKGGKDEFLKAVEKTHGDNKYGKFYKKIVEVYTEE
jgi:hypothetical protein